MRVDLAGGAAETAVASDCVQEIRVEVAVPGRFVKNRCLVGTPDVKARDDCVWQLVEDRLPLRLPDPLDNHLFCSLGCNAGKTGGVHLHPERVANLHFGVDLLRFSQIDLLVGILYFINYGDELEEFNFTRIFIKRRFPRC